jgi:hypothetical protein
MFNSTNDKRTLYFVNLMKLEWGQDMLLNAIETSWKVLLIVWRLEPKEEMPNVWKGRSSITCNIKMF